MTCRSCTHVHQYPDSLVFTEALKQLTLVSESEDVGSDATVKRLQLTTTDGRELSQSFFGG